MAKNNSILSYRNFRTASAWLIFLVGLVFYFFGYSELITTTIWKNLLIKAGDVLVIGVIIGYLSNAAQFLGVFKQDLQDIIYGREFLKQRKDISPLWDAVSKEMFKNKFPQIHKDFLKAIQGYFPSDEVSYYNDYEANITIEWQDRSKGTIKVTHQISFELVADNKDSFDYPLRTWTRTCNGEDFIDNISQIKVNGAVPNLTNPSLNKVDDNNVCKEQKITLSGSSKYSIEYTREKEYSIDVDYTIGMRSKYIINGLRVSVDFPEDIDVTFLCRGTQGEFEDIRHNRKDRIEKKYKGIILPRQGYIFALRKKK